MILIQLLEMMPSMNHNKQRLLLLRSMSMITMWHQLIKRMLLQHLTPQGGCLASGQLELVHVLVVFVTILNTCSQKHWNKLVSLQGQVLQDSTNLAQFLLLGLVQKLGCHLGLCIWDYLVQETQFQLQVKGNFGGICFYSGRFVDYSTSEISQSKDTIR